MNQIRIIQNFFRYIIKTIKYILYISYYFSKKNRILFIPHPQMSKDDGYNIINYKSDNALYLAN